MTQQQRRRAPEPGQRQRDPERTKRLILEAGTAEFAARGYAATRISDIAGRAGVNSQLISYYFGGKEGLYQAVQRQWWEADARIADPELPLGRVVVDYLRSNAECPELGRLLVWSGLTGEGVDEPGLATRMQQHLADLRRRQAAGELAADLDPAYVLLALFGAAAARLAFPHIARAITGTDPDSPEFTERYAAELARMVERLAD
ncbi:TetR/AcrR family transcriptional regulator [Kitasatospora viridis]|uniref:TetR family transcriptional regulator n=1 Tax=Kitasatospora viridis TaxID=281105 RepID=A0A561SE02_9ACTN|nr:TetR family transcriptional regulator [Kitasatospora viridis]TWF73096.1 TetR family transcriptional regulator [Kitasatospora viridis]